MKQPIFLSRFQGAILSGLVLRVGWTELHQIWGGHWTFIGVLEIRLAFRYVAAFQNHSASKAIGWSKTEAKYRTF